MPKTLTSKESLVNKEFNKVRKIVCRKLQNFKNYAVTRFLTEHLQEIMPRIED